MKGTIIVNGCTMHLVFGKTLQEWKKKYGSNDDLWDILLGEFVNGSVEVQEDIWYWLIGDRCYETTEQA